MKACVRLLLIVAVFSLTGCGTLLNRIEGSINLGNNAPTPGARNITEGCSPTFSDEPSPTYKANAPIRSVVGHGHVLTGVVLSSHDCQPIPNAKLEFWPEEAGRGHPDASRATLFSDSAGKFRFECNPPEHIHMRISAAGFRTVFNNSYHPNGASEGEFNIVLIPEQ